MAVSRSSPVVVGIDVGGRKKGFHAVALKNGQYHSQFAATNVAALVAWCVNTVTGTVIAVDAPCRWSRHETGRPAERELMCQRIWCFSTPTRREAINHPKGYYDWMLRGEALYRALQPTHPVCASWPARRERYCFETFPHAIAWHLRGGNADAKRKRTQRPELLTNHGIATDELTNIDWVDAALCALSAHMVGSGGQVETFGAAETGYIIVPSRK